MALHPFANAGLKALSLALAILLWFSVSRDSLVERSIRVPLEFQNIPEGLEIVGDAPAAVDVRVRGTSGLLGRVAPGEIVAILDLRGARPGQRLFHLLTDEVRAPFGIQVTQIQPPTVPLAFERSATRMVPVVPAVEGQPAPGYVLGAVTSDPPVVEVVGPESRLNQLAQATTEPISVQNATRRVTDQLTVGVPDSAVRLRAGRSARVTVDIVAAPIERTVKDVAVVVLELARGRRAAVQPPRVAVRLQGPRDAVAGVDPATLRVFVDAGRLGPGRYTLPVRAGSSGAAGVEISGTDPATVHVRLR